MVTEDQNQPTIADMPAGETDGGTLPAEPWGPSDHREAHRDGGDEGRVITIGWQVVLLGLLAVVAVVGGVVVGRRYAASGSAAVPVAVPAAQSAAQAAAPVGPVLGAGGAQVREFEMGEPADRIEIQPPAVGEGFGAMPGVPHDQVVELPPSIHILRGKPAPPLEMASLDTGEVVRLSDYAGRPVLVNFWATWCPPCRLEMPWLQSVHDRYADEGFVVLAVDAGERVPPSLAADHIRRFVDGISLTVPVLYGENTFDVQREWTVIGLPASFLIGRDGTVVDVHTGAYPNEPTLEHAIQQILVAGE